MNNSSSPYFSDDENNHANLNQPNQSPSPSEANNTNKNINKHIYTNLYQPVGDKNKNNGLETQFLLDTGATSSIINYYTCNELCKTQKIDLVKIKTNTVAVNGEKLKLLGYITFNSSFDIEGKYNVKIKTWVSAKDGCKQFMPQFMMLGKEHLSVQFCEDPPRSGLNH